MKRETQNNTPRASKKHDNTERKLYNLNEKETGE